MTVVNFIVGLIVGLCFSFVFRGPALSEQAPEYGNVLAMCNGQVKYYQNLILEYQKRPYIVEKIRNDYYECYKLEQFPSSGQKNVGATK